MAEREYERDDAGKFSGVGGGVARKQHEALAKLGKAKKDAPAAAPKHEFREAKVEDFHKAFTAAFKDSDFTNHVTHYTEDQLKGMKLYTTKDGKAGVAVHDHGDGRIEATALFSTVKGSGAGMALLDHVIDNAGVNYVECYGPKLSKMYAGLGFKDSSSSRFDKAQAASSWNFKRFDSPNYHTMKLVKD
jgi:hypothetical protein